MEFLTQADYYKGLMSLFTAVDTMNEKLEAQNALLSAILTRLNKFEIEPVETVTTVTTTETTKKHAGRPKKQIINE